MTQTIDAREAKYSSILNTDPELRHRWAASPQVFVSSAPLVPGKNFYMIWLYLGKDKFSTIDLWSVIRRTVQLGVNNDMFSGMVGGEIVPCFLGAEDVRGERILRLSFLTPSIDGLLELEANSLLAGDIIPDQIRCSWYLQPPPHD